LKFYDGGRKREEEKTGILIFPELLPRGARRNKRGIRSDVKCA